MTVVAAWPDLPEAIRAGILAMVESASRWDLGGKLVVNQRPLPAPQRRWESRSIDPSGCVAMRYKPSEAAWPELTQAVRVGILAMVRAAL
jgi:hypothetical protein